MHVTTDSASFNEFRNHIRLLKRARIIPRYDDLIERDAFVSALTRLNPTLPLSEARLHANIIIDDRVQSPGLTDEDMKYAMLESCRRQMSLTHQSMYLAKHIQAIFSKWLSATKKAYRKEAKAMYKQGKTLQSANYKAGHSTLETLLKI